MRPPVRIPSPPATSQCEPEVPFVFLIEGCREGRGRPEPKGRSFRRRRTAGLSWINAMVEGLRRYGQHDLHEVCSNLQDEGEAPQPEIIWFRPGRSRSCGRGWSLLTGHVQDCLEIGRA